MTATHPDPAGEFFEALTPQAKAGLMPTRHLSALIARAVVDHHWTPAQLAAEASRDLGSAVKPGAVITRRLEHCARNPPAHRAGRAGAKLGPWCGRPDCDPDTRWIEHPETRRPLRRCDCATGEATQ
jgi:hypothetical protein